MGQPVKKHGIDDCDMPGEGWENKLGLEALPVPEIRTVNLLSPWQVYFLLNIKAGCSAMPSVN